MHTWDAAAPIYTHIIVYSAQAPAICTLYCKSYMMMPTIERVVQVTGGSSKRDPWTVKNISIIDGTEFVDLQKTDTGFNRFISGTWKGLPTSSFMSTLRKKRNFALMGHAESHDMLGNKMPEPSRYEQVKMRTTRTENSYVDIDMPAVDYDSEHAPATTLRIAASKAFNSGVKIELKPENLHYVRLAMLASCDDSPGKRHKPQIYAPKGTRWVARKPNRVGFLAIGVHQKTKFFACTNADDEDAISKCRLQAVDWTEDKFCGDDNDAADDDDDTDVVHTN